MRTPSYWRRYGDVVEVLRQLVLLPIEMCVCVDCEQPPHTKTNASLVKTHWQRKHIRINLTLGCHSQQLIQYILGHLLPLRRPLIRRRQLLLFLAFDELGFIEFAVQSAFRQPNEKVSRFDRFGEGWRQMFP